MLTQHEEVIDFCVVGSAIYHPEPKDLDFLVLTKHASFIGGTTGDGNGAARWAFGEEWLTIGGRYDDQTDKWGSIRKDDVNLIVTVDPEWFKRAKLANEVCAALKLMDKGDRIVTYRVIRDGYSAEQANLRRDGSR